MLSHHVVAVPSLTRSGAGSDFGVLEEGLGHLGGVCGGGGGGGLEHEVAVSGGGGELVMSWLWCFGGREDVEKRTDAGGLQRGQPEPVSCYR